MSDDVHVESTPGEQPPWPRSVGMIACDLVAPSFDPLTTRRRVLDAADRLACGGPTECCNHPRPAIEDPPTCCTLPLGHDGHHAHIDGGRLLHAWPSRCSELVEKVPLGLCTLPPRHAGAHRWSTNDLEWPVTSPSTKEAAVGARIFRYEVPVDDCWHDVALSGEVLHVACRRPDVVDLWALHSGGTEVVRSFRVFGTGQPLGVEIGQHAGTAITPDGRLVWHLMERLR